MNKVIILIVVLVCVVWFAPDRPYKVLNALHDMVQAAGPTVLPSRKADQSEDPSTVEGLIGKVKDLL